MTDGVLAMRPQLAQSHSPSSRLPSYTRSHFCASTEWLSHNSITAQPGHGYQQGGSLTTQRSPGGSRRGDLQGIRATGEVVMQGRCVLEILVIPIGPLHLDVGRDVVDRITCKLDELLCLIRHLAKRALPGYCQYSGLCTWLHARLAALAFNFAATIMVITAALSVASRYLRFAWR
ncbi:hypothetical protein BJV78DRAFT_1156437 [Lactifluus subvellereus]|nr:hypothetical protein BJV78DRAFT_1156437 [Lactifluus subvellereus]